VIQSNAWNSIFSSLCPTPDQMDFVSLSNYTARTAIWGQGPPLVILPGIAGGFELMGPVIEELSKSFKIYSFQYRGEDNFFSVRNCISFSDFEQDLDEILAFWRLEKPNIFGASFGGALALKYALNNPNKLGSVITQGTGIKYERGIIQRLASMILSYYQVPETNPFVNQFFRLFLGGKSFSDEQIESIARVCWSTDQAVIRGRLRILKQFDLTNCKKKINVPTLFLKGQKDILLSHDNFAQLQDLCVNNEMHIIGKLGHLAFFQSPKLIAKIIHDFISDKVECINFAYHP
jgi:pimeloyl-ACP methyl ester carboxylesterase